MLRDIAYFGVIAVLVLMAGAAMFSGAGATTGLALGGAAVALLMWAGGEVDGTVSE